MKMEENALAIDIHTNVYKMIKCRYAKGTERNRERRSVRLRRRRSSGSSRMNEEKNHPLF